MGAKVTIDSASMMNKALEVIEAHHLFNLPGDRIRVVIHPQSVVHSFVEFMDGSVLAQMGPPDMKSPIQYALTWPDRLPGCSPTMNWREEPPPGVRRHPASPSKRTSARCTLTPFSIRMRR